MLNTLKTRGAALLCLLTFTLIPAVSSAQVDPGEGAATGGFFSGSSSTFSTIIGLPLTTTGGVVLLIVNLNKSNSAQLEHYLNHSYEDVHASLRVQDAELPATQDLAFLFGISQAYQQDFADLLVNERETLAPLLDDEQVSSDEAYAFAVHIIDAMQAHPTLSGEVQRQLDAYHAAQAAQ